MKIAVKAKPNSKQDKVEKISGGEFLLRVKSPAKEGKANQAVIRLLSEYFDIPKTRIKIIKGLASRDKVIEIA